MDRLTRQEMLDNHIPKQIKGSVVFFYYGSTFDKPTQVILNNIHRYSFWDRKKII